MTNTKIKKFIATACIASVVATGSAFALPVDPAQAANVIIYVDGQTVSSDVDPTIIDGRSMLPVRAIGEALGATVVWDSASRSAIITKGSTTLRLAQGQYSYTLNGTSYSLDVPITIINGRTMAPVRVISEALGATVDWNSGVVNIYTSTTIVRVNDLGTGSYANLRQGPGTNYNIVGAVYSGQYLQVIGQSGDWYKIRTSNGADAYVASWLVTVWNGSTTPTTPDTEDPSEGNGTTTGDTNGTLSVTNRNTSVQGQASITFNIGSGSPSVVSNDGTQLVMQIDDAQISTRTWNPVQSMSPFTGFTVQNYGSNAVRLTADVSQGGYFRLDINGNAFTVTAVAKHKNGQTGLAGKTIVVSAGHGIYSTGGVIDRGAVSTIDPSFDEVDFNTYVAQKLRDKLEAVGATVIMIREDENPIDMSLYERSVVTNEANADAFIEIHGDSASSSASGIGTWAYVGSSRLTSAAQVDMRNEFASVMNQAMNAATGEPAYVKYENFSVLRETEVPCVLIECGFLSNAHDLALLKDPAYWEKLAQGMYNGLAKYFAY